MKSFEHGNFQTNPRASVRQNTRSLPLGETQRSGNSPTKYAHSYLQLANLLALFLSFYLLCFCWLVLSCQFLSCFLGLSQMANAGVPPDL